MKPVLSIVALAALAACAAPTTPIVTTVPFDPQEVAFIQQRGPASIEGQAFMRQQGGGVVTCAGEEVALIPAGRYATQRITGIYGNNQSGFAPLYTLGRTDDTTADARAYAAAARLTACDAQGNFRFDGVANGDYFVTTAVRWMAGNYGQGGALMQRVSIRNGQSQRILLSS